MGEPRTLLLVALTLLTSLFVPAASTGQSPTSALTVDDHWIDIYQQDEGEFLLVKETLWFNNTLKENFNADLYAWLPEGAQLRSMCVIEGASTETCFETDQIDENLIKGNPFGVYTPFISYYGQRVELNLTASGDSGAVKLAQTIVLEGKTTGHEVNATSDNLTLTSDRDIIGIELGNISNIPQNMTLLQNVSLKNSAEYNRTIDLRVEEMPSGWNGWFFDEEGNNSIRLLPGEIKNLTLHMQIPSYIIKIRFEYLYQMSVSGEEKKQGSFEKQMIYNTTKVEVYVFALPEAKVTLSNNLLNLDYGLYEPYNREWYLGKGYAMEPGSKNKVTISWEEEGAGIDWGWIAALAVVGLIFGIPVLYRGGLLTRKNSVALSDDDKPLTSVKKENNMEVVEGALLTLDKQFRKGSLSKKVYLEMKQSYQETLTELTDEDRVEEASQDG